MVGYLSLEEVSGILPREMRIDFKVKRRDYIVYSTTKGDLLPIANAKVINDTFSYNICTEYYKTIGCKYVGLVLGFLGIILIPIDVLIEYNKKSGWKMITKKGKQYWIRGNVRNEGVRLTCSNDHSSDIDAKQYFIPYKSKTKTTNKGTKK